jgi:chemotaxis protein MotB
MRKLVLSAMFLLPLAGGCVSQGKYDQAVTDAREARAQLVSARGTLGRRLDQREAEIKRLHSVIDEATARCAGTAGELEDERAQALSCSKALDDATAMNQELRSELERQGRDVDELLAAKGTLASSLEQAKARLEELRRAQAAADARAAVFRDLALRLKRMIDAGDLKISLRSGRMVLVLPTDVLFDSGKTAIKPAGKETLAELAKALASFEGRRFQVAGHTDDEPIRFSGFASNWELSAERALRVVELLVQNGMKPAALSAAGYGEFDALRPNDGAENRAQNRRIEITLQPTIDELVKLPEAR